PVQHGENILIGDSPDEFARYTVRLLQDPFERRRLALAGRGLVEIRYSWSTAADVVEAALRNLIHTIRYNTLPTESSARCVHSLTCAPSARNGIKNFEISISNAPKFRFQSAICRCP